MKRAGRERIHGLYTAVTVRWLFLSRNKTIKRYLAMENGDREYKAIVFSKIRTIPK